LIEVAGEVTKDNMYDCINYIIENIPNFVPVLGFTSSLIYSTILLIGISSSSSVI
jgi:hypothetical protein